MLSTKTRVSDTLLDTAVVQTVSVNLKLFDVVFCPLSKQAHMIMMSCRRVTSKSSLALFGAIFLDLVSVVIRSRCSHFRATVASGTS